MIQTALNALDPERRAVAMQAARYAFAGAVITVLVAASYWAVAEFLHVDPMLSLTLVFLFFTGVSYVTHGAYSFRGHGGRDRSHVRATRFLSSTCRSPTNRSSSGFWSSIGRADWWPVIAIIFFTPLVTFTLHRRWVFA